MHYYGMIIRPFAPGAQPSGWSELRKGFSDFWNILAYEDALSQDVLRQYGLVSVTEKQAVKSSIIMTSKRR